MPDGRFQGRKVSDPWDVILTDAAKRVSFRLNDGRRTMSEQAALYRRNMSGGRPRPGRPLTARPNPNAPHIMVGRDNHSLDVDQFVGDGEQALERELERMGLVIVNDVPGEGWHQTEPDQARLRRVAARIVAGQIDHTPTLRKGMKPNPDAVRRFQRLLRGAGVRGVPVNGRYDLATRIATKRYQRKHSIPADARATVGDKTWAQLRNTGGK